MKVVNLRSWKGSGCLVKVDRSSILGNPFRMKKDCPAERDRVIAVYRAYLWEEIQKHEDIYAELNRIRILEQLDEVYLGCWCAPKPCHGDVIKAAIEWMDEQDEKEVSEMTQEEKVLTVEEQVAAAVRPGMFIPPRPEPVVEKIDPEHKWDPEDFVIGGHPEEDDFTPAAHPLPECRNRRFVRTAKKMYAKYGMNPDPDKELEERTRAKYKHDMHRMYTPEQFKEMEHDLQRCGGKKGGQGYVSRTHTNQWWNVYNLLGEGGFHIVGA